MPSSLHDFPHEIIRHILLYVSPEDNLRIAQLLSRGFYHLGNEGLLWRQYCRTSFTYWHPDHQIERKFAAIPSSVAWKQLWITKKRSTTKVARLLDGILSTKRGQLERLQQICLLGYDAKDYLLEQCRVDESAEDVLARRYDSLLSLQTDHTGELGVLNPPSGDPRSGMPPAIQYYANSALDSIHRGIAVDVWSKYQGAPLSTRGLDRALGAFDMFVLHDQDQDLDYISRSFDDLAERFRCEHSAFEDMSTRQKALALVRWLRANNLTGLEHPERNYRNLRNCLIGHALSDEEHPSIPLISSAIFSCVAERLGMTSSCCAFPSHVHASVFAAPGLTLDGEEELNPDAELEHMYLDPYGSDDEVTLIDLKVRLVEFGWTQGADVFLRASPVPIIVQRTAQNIKATYAAAQGFATDDPRKAGMKRLRVGHPDLNLEAACYSSMWAELLMKQTSSLHWDANLDSFLNRFALSWSEDAWIVEKYLVPLYDAFVDSQAGQRQRQRLGWENVHQILDMLRNLDKRTPTVSRRYTEEIHSRVRYKIGQVFRHKRYNYIGVINGWDATGTASLPTPHYLNADDTEEDTPVLNLAEHGDIPQRRATTFYTCLRPTVDRLRVSQDNMEIITDASLIPEALFFLAGKFFKRFDRDACTFVSNLKEFYPDD
ncbi:hypothetical protein B0H66DRAFT_607155 [Apodospora peruviana]|uniref:F-box domain-containing protein n=1 Tax=Apodospora peruviana TaxID=516989 RepID=A0AAE0HW07_9PEZI|nr:hypothetical protein B0H66DRAFT_607155 [Apodospora peruviana]